MTGPKQTKHIQHVYIIDDDDAVRSAMCMLFESENISYVAFSSGNVFLENYDSTMSGCLVLDIRMPGLSGLEIQKQLIILKSVLPIIFISGHGDLPMAVKAMRRGAINFLRKPINEQELLDGIREAFEQESGVRQEQHSQEQLYKQYALLTQRERQVLSLVTNGETNKAIALELGISERTVEVHRSHVMTKFEVKTLAQLIRVAITLE